MTTIIRATLKDKELLAKLGKTTFIEAHGKSASKDIIDTYVSKKFSVEAFEDELKESNNIFYILYYNEKAVGYSKVIFNCQHSNILSKNITKLERLYVLEDFHSLKLGLALFDLNCQEAIKNQQSGMWLFVWTENQKAINFYKKVGFNAVGYHDFELSPTHYNLNHQMLLLF